MGLFGEQAGDRMREIAVVVGHPEELHARPAARFVQTARRFPQPECASSTAAGRRARRACSSLLAWGWSRGRWSPSGPKGGRGRGAGRAERGGNGAVRKPPAGLNLREASVQRPYTASTMAGVRKTSRRPPGPAGAHDGQKELHKIGQRLEAPLPTVIPGAGR